MKFQKLLLTATFLAAFPATAHAQDNSADVQALRAEIAALKDQIVAISAKVDSNAKAAEKKGGTEIKWKGAPELEGDGGWTFKPRGRLLFDAANVDGPTLGTTKPGFSNELRRARLGVQGDMPGGFGYKFEVDFVGSKATLTDGFFTYHDKGLLVTAGQHNNFQSLEELSSSNDTSFIERAAFTDAFGFERRVGASVQYTKGDALFQGGVFTDNVASIGGEAKNSYSVDGRIVYAPKLGAAQIHLGASGHWRDLEGATTTVAFSQRPLVHSTSLKYLGVSIPNAESQLNFGAEAAVISGRFHAAAEANRLKTKRVGFADPGFFGASIEAGYFLTNNSRSYKDGIFKSTKVKNGVDHGGIGAIQINARYDRLDMTDRGAGIIGGTQDGYMASLIWTPIEYVRFMINYGHLEYKDAKAVVGGATSYSADVIGTRAQISF